MSVPTQSRLQTKQYQAQETRAAHPQESASRLPPGESRAVTTRGLFDELALLRRAGILLKSEPAEARRLLSVYDERYPEGVLREDYDVLMVRLERA